MSICEICGTETKKKGMRFCSRPCNHAWRRNNKKPSLNPNLNIISLIDGKSFADYENRGGSLTRYSRDTLGRKFNWADWKIVEIQPIQKPTWNCPYCKWRTVDKDNKSGRITTHLETKHNHTPESHCQIHPEDKSLWQIYWMRLEHTKFINEIEDNRIQCLICHQWMKKITNRHLKDKHGITNSEYKLQFGLSNLSSTSTRKKISNHYFKHGGLSTYNYTSTGQSEIEEFIQSLGFETRIRRKDHVELDIFIPERNIAIEYNGLYWHAEKSSGKPKDYHLAKTEYCESIGIHLIHIFEDEWANKPEIIKSRIRNILGKNEIKYSARNLSVCEIDTVNKNIFLIENHLQGKDNSSIRLGLFHNEMMVSCMTFRKPNISMGYRNINDNVIELARFCNLQNTTVIGGANKLFSHFLKTYPIYKKIISYADRRWTSSRIPTLYDKLGFQRIGITQPNYWYMKGHSVRLARFNFTKQKIMQKFPAADESLSEWENMSNAGYDRIWDCGSLNIDIRVMSRCSLGFNPNTGKAICEYCHESARTDGSECDYDALKRKLSGLPAGVELAIGGNSLSSGLIDFIQWAWKYGYIVNLTINQLHAQMPKVAEKLAQMLNDSEIKGLGISYRKDFPFKVPEFLIHHRNTVGHVIAGIDDVDDIIATPFKKILVLGYKIFGFGEGFYSDEIRRNIDTWVWWVRKLFDVKDVLSFDNLALEQLRIHRFFPKDKWEEFHQGEHSFYINAVDGTFSPSSRSSMKTSWENISVREYFSRLNPK